MIVSDRHSPTTEPSFHSVGIYLRKSTSKQELSLSAQERVIRQSLEQRGLGPVFHVYHDILSGQRADRSGYQQMLSDARAGKITTIAFHKINRFGRDAAEGLAAVSMLRRLNVQLFVADLPFLDIHSPEGMLLFTLMLGQGQYEVENLGHEATKGMRESFHRGRWPFAVPFGYERIYPGGSGRTIICVNPRAAAIVRLMFYWYIRGASMAEITRRLYALDAQRRQRGKSGCAGSGFPVWRSQYLSRMLRNPFYVQRMVSPRWNLQQQGLHQPIVPFALFERVQRQLVIARRAYGRHTYPLQRLGVLDGQTAFLGSAYNTKIERRYYVYVDEQCRRRHLPAAPIERQVWERVDAALARLHARNATIATSITHAQRRLKVQQRDLQRRIAERRMRLLDLASEGIFTTAELRTYTAQLAAEEAAVAGSDQIQVLASMRSDWFTSYIDLWHEIRNGSFAAQNSFLRDVLDRVIITPEGEVKRLEWAVQWRVLFEFLDDGTTQTAF